jgi:D-alanyl-D-alanine carboxypeptidase
MFARIGLALLCCAVLVAPAPRAFGAVAPFIADPAVQRAVVAAVENDRALYGGKSPVHGVLIGIFDDSGHSYVHGFGYADLKTKTFVVGVLMQLVVEGKLSFDDPLSKFDIGVAVPNAKNITIRQLCNMRSGIFEAYDTPQLQKLDPGPDATIDPRTIIKWAVEQKPYFAPGKGYHYSNTGYLILGLIIEKLTNDTLADQIHKRLLLPLNLTQTSVPHTQAMPNPWARGYGLDTKKNWEDVSDTVPVSLMGAAGDMISDLNDMKRWIKLFVLGKTGEPAGFDPRKECRPFGDGNLGFGLGLACGGAGWYGYTGGLPGYNTADYYFPERGITIVAWVDAQLGSPNPGAANAIFRDIARILTPENRPFAGKNGKI